MATNPDVKLIENHIKNLLFSPPASSDKESNLTPFLYDTKCLLSNVENEVYNKDVSTPNCKARSSQLIDLNVLTNFAAKHADISKDVILNAPKVLPHPEQENDMLLFPSHLTPKDVESVSSVEASPSKFKKGTQKDSTSKEKKTRKKGKTKKEKDKNKTKESEQPKAQQVSKKGSIKKEVSKSQKNKESTSENLDILSKNQLPEDTKVYSILSFEGFLKFSCELCNFDARFKDVFEKHLLSDSHKQNLAEAELEQVLPFLPDPLPLQSEAITKLLLQCHSEFGLQEEDLLKRKELADQLKSFVEKEIQGCCLELVGSSATGFGLKSSAVDMSFKVLPEYSVPDSLQLLYEKLKTDPLYIGVVSKFKEKTPGIGFCDQQTGLGCSIDYERGAAEKSSKLFSHYYKLDTRVPVLGTAFRYWAHLCSIDSQEKGTLPAYSYTLLLVYFLQQVEPPVLPVLHEIKEFGNVDFVEQYIEGNKWKSENRDSIGELWIKLFHFYNYVYELGEHVVCIRQYKKLLSSEKNWSTKFYAIEDPFVRRNIAHVIPSYQVFYFIQQCFFRTHRYFAFPQIREGKIELQKTKGFATFIQQQKSVKKTTKCEDEDSESEIQDFEDQDPDLDIVECALSLQHMRIEVPEREKMCSWNTKKLKYNVNSFIYRMDDATIFKGKKDLPYSCKLCKSSGHTRKKCPKDELPPRSNLPSMNPDFLKMINKILYYIRDKNCVDENDRKFMTKNMQEIESHIRKRLPDATLSMFGSFCNGFGFKTRSDMDFCLTFNGHDNGKDFDSSEVIEAIAKELMKFPRLENILPVTSAKVPIVKFSCTLTGIEGDISLYNTLALANTRMLEAYSKIDMRVQVLGFALKYFTKLLGICDASRGSLSSYAYILMVIFFLQQRNPPVIPVLQEIFDGKEKPVELIEGWNVWYFKDIDRLKSKWKDMGKNRESPAELWLGLLSFYAYDFNWREYVVSIRQKSLITRFQKLWVTDQLAIEDPFELSHNLGAGLSHKMNMYILKTFVRGRERFGKPVDNLYDLNGHEVSYLFDRLFLNMGSEPPHDRGCRICGKIGHLAKNCSQEKLCNICKKGGHIAKNCPIKVKTKQKRMERNQSNFSTPNSVDTRNTEIQKHRSIPDNSRDSSQKHLMQMGYPSHRLPPPRGQKNFMNTSGPPPGFNFPQNGTSLPRMRFPVPGVYPPRPFVPPSNFVKANVYQDKMGPPPGWRPNL